MILRFDDYARESVFEAQVVVVGTGAGGAVAGCELAEAGADVLFVEEGSYIPPSSFNPFATESLVRLFRDASATFIFGRPNIPYIEGRCVGGSTVVNGGMTYRPPERVLDRWKRLIPDLDLPFERVERAIHADHQLEISIGEDNRIMAEGARRMGWKFEINRRNQKACVGANNCIFGCPTGAKQSALVTYIPRALKAGARCLTEVRVERLLIERGRCVGVAGRAIDPRTRRPMREVTVRARAVVLACGAVQTPALLLGHRLGGWVGRNFMCHPNAKVLAVYPHRVEGWKGVSQWTQIREFHDQGILMAENMAAPSAVASYIPFHGRRAWQFMSQYNRMVMSGVLVEDSGAGRIRRGPLGLAMPFYNITPLDHRRFLYGIRRLAEMHFAMGAESVLLPFSNLPLARSVDDLRKIEPTQRSVMTLELFSVHLMGSVRMGSARENSAVNADGELWDLPGCYVADASLFPTAIGVNPQVTIMALATRVAWRLAERLRRRA